VVIVAVVSPEAFVLVLMLVLDPLVVVALVSEVVLSEAVL
jgi:hypothetical protein